ncbi:uncharacterized protein LOC109847177 [Asparagus officinalis]|uniref:uncharacterized protein LOC109847177 n=1 Tax=Asparagus officinalis TaxID=4686 RepID=UPI00098E75D9|nr:uncharacterized protein LOC109847177 [Asparagus officinalis]
MKILKTQFSIVFDMLNCSGFGWDTTKQCVTAEKEVWVEYFLPKNTIPFREKFFPHYETLAIVIGKDRATGKGMEHPTNVIEELDKEVSQETVREDFIDIDSPSQDATTGDTSDVSLKRKRKK